MAKHKRRKRRPSSSGLLLFIVGFIGCLLLFGGGAYIWWQVAQPDLIGMFFKQPESAPSPSTSNADDLFFADNRFSYAVYITDNDGQLQSFTLAMFCPDIQTTAVVGIPVEYSLSSENDSETLLRQFRLNGAEQATAALANVLPQTPEYYLVATYDDVEAFFEKLDRPLVMHLPKDVNESAPDGSFSIHLTAGEHAMSPRQLVNLLKCTNWQSGRRERADMHALLVKSYIQQFVSEKRTLSEDYSTLASIVQTNLPIDRFHQIETELKYLITDQVAESPMQLPVTGVFRGEGSTLRFMPDTPLYQELCFFNTKETATTTTSANETAVPDTTTTEIP